jgi:hypothetical protein
MNKQILVAILTMLLAFVVFIFGLMGNSQFMLGIACGIVMGVISILSAPNEI